MRGIHRTKGGGQLRVLNNLTWSGPVMTTGQIADYCGVCTRTVSKWCDSGNLKAYRVPGSLDRRIPVKEVYRFLTANSWPVGDDLRNLVNPKQTVLTYGLPAGVLPPTTTETLDVAAVEGVWDLGLRVAAPNTAGVVVIGCGVGRSEATALLEKIKQYGWLGVYCHGPDQTPEMFPAADMVLDAALSGPEITAAVLGFLNKEINK